MHWRIAARPRGRELRIDDFTAHDDGPREPLQPGEVRLRTLLLSCDPAQKGWMENAGGYAAPTNVGDIMPATGIGQVVESTVAELAPGDFVAGPLGWRHEAVVAAALLDELPPDRDHLPRHLGALGGSGLTAYFGMATAAHPFPGDTLVVTGAGGAVGSVAGQIGRIGGCRVIGIAGGPAKCRWLIDELGFDAAIDYKSQDLKAMITEHAPGGIDILWDNVGGDQLDILLGRLALGARVVLCGGIARYEQPGRPAGPSNYFNLVFRRATMTGILLTDHKADFPRARQRLAGWIDSGRLHTREDIADGLENAPQILMRLFRGDNIGKLLIRVADPL
ncbi:NADP-dependent oxidoreductase [Sandarakinorhabdus sp. DWP1-3-1]|uniref:NADP-dependent oxidoreductase n=1 Tax=Sandarakinorhabdus sp. DWP1-3-1 TaxID=2804627 RepID=UPI003CEE5F66